MNKKLCEIDFIDLYLRDDYSYFKGLAGENGAILIVPEEFKEEIGRIREICSSEESTSKRREFSFMLDDVLYRVAVFSHPHEGETYVIRQKRRDALKLAALGLSRATQDFLLEKELKGAVLVLGEMSSGKTSTISSSISARLEAYGGLALVLEDPIETGLTGKIGNGLAIQIEVDPEKGGYSEQLVRGMRSNADIFMIGEIRDGTTAAEFLRAGSNGHLLFSSAHAQSIPHGLGRLSSLIGGNSADVNSIMSQSLSLVIYQTLVRSKKAGGEGVNCRLTSSVLQIERADNESAIREKIKTGQFKALQEDITAQKNNQRWNQTN